LVATTHSNMAHTHSTCELAPRVGGKKGKASMIRTGIGPPKVVGEEHENMRLVRSEREGKPRQPDKRRKCHGGWCRCHVC
jgi:hypothetical protein